jgi:hypothetical protein
LARSRALPVALVLLGLLAACAETHVSGREVLRLAPLRESTPPPGAAAPEVILDAGSDALTDDELARLQTHLAQHLAAAVERSGARATVAPRGTARVQRCALRAGAGRRNTTYLARCRVALLWDGVPVVEAEAEAVRLTGARAVTKERANEIRKGLARGERHPLLSYDDARLALEAALDAAVKIAVTGDVPRAEGEPAPVAVDVPLMRKDALRRLERDRGPALAAAAVDLARWGEPEDGAALLPLLDDGDPLVRRAAATALGELGARAGWVPLHERRDDRDEKVAAAIHLAIARLSALYPELSEVPSNSSTAGGGE